MKLHNQARIMMKSFGCQSKMVIPDPKEAYDQRYLQQKLFQNRPLYENKNREIYNISTIEVKGAYYSIFTSF